MAEVGWHRRSDVGSRQEAEREVRWEACERWLWCWCSGPWLCRWMRRRARLLGGHHARAPMAWALESARAAHRRRGEPHEATRSAHEKKRPQAKHGSGEARHVELRLKTTAGYCELYSSRRCIIQYEYAVSVSGLIRKSPLGTNLCTSIVTSVCIIIISTGVSRGRRRQKDTEQAQLTSGNSQIAD